jgi:hypothetical protein
MDPVLREALARRIGADLFHEAWAISVRTVEATAAVVSRLVDRSDYGSLAEEGFGEAMVADALVRHLSHTP